MRKLSGDVSLTIMGLVIASVGVIAPIILDWWNKKAELTIETRQSIIILQKEKSIKQLEIFYGGKSINSLSKTILVLKNTGRTAITKDDVVNPPTIKFENAEILEISMSRQAPPNLGATISNENSNEVLVKFPLLNPGDEIELSVMTASGVPKFSADTRIKNIGGITLSAREVQIRGEIGWGVYIVGLFSFFATIGCIGFLVEIPAKKKSIADIKAGSAPLRRATSKEEIESYVSTQLNFLSTFNRKSISDALRSKQFPIPENEVASLENLILAMIGKEDSVGLAVIAFAFAAIGIWYVMSSALV